MDYLLEVKGLTKFFGGLRAVSDLDLGVAEGEIAGLIGPNGAGKSTVLNLVNGFLKPSQGNVIFGGTDITGWSPSSVARQGMGRVFQLDVLFESLNVQQSVEVGSHTRHRDSSRLGGLMPASRRRRARSVKQHVERVLELVGLADQAATPVTSLPHGKKRLLGLAVALAADPRLVLLDEPMTGMNAGETAEMLNIIRTLNSQSGITFLVVEHNMDAVMSLCSSLTVISFGSRIAYGPPSVISNDPVVIDAYLGVADENGTDGEDGHESEN